MPFTEEDKIIIKHYRIEKGYGRTKLLKEFPNRGWTLGGLGDLLKKLDETGSVRRKVGSGGSRTVRTEENIDEVLTAILSQEDKPGTHETPAQIAKNTGISLSSVRRIIKEDLQLQPFKKIPGQKLTDMNEHKRVECAKKLLRQLTPTKLNCCFFSDENFFTIEPPLNSQNDRVYGAAATLKNQISDERLLCQIPLP